MFACTGPMATSWLPLLLLGLHLSHLLAVQLFLLMSLPLSLLLGEAVAKYVDPLPRS